MGGVLRNYFLLLSVLLLPATLHADVQVTHIVVRNEGSLLMFDFRACSKAAGLVRLTDIVVNEVGHLPDLCRRSSLTRLPIEVRSWTYGSLLPGVSETRCENLRAGTRYSIATLSAGADSTAGQQEFSIDEHGRVRKYKDSCGLALEPR
jgi:hypothetical protein